MTSPRPVRLTTSDGLNLDGDETIPVDAWAAVVLLHPHPLHGGDRHSFVTGILNGALPGAGIATLRFDFRGVGRSEGVHGEGIGERLDVIAAVDHLSALLPDIPLVLCGWSFGADVSLTVDDPRVAGWVAIAPPIGEVPPRAMVAGADHRPTLLLVPEHDQFRTPARTLGSIHGWHSTALEVLWGADHSCTGRTDRVAEAVVTFCRSVD